MRRFVLILCSLAATTACGAKNPSSSNAGTDASVPTEDGATAGTCPPTDPFGASPGYNLRGFTLPRCDGTEVDLYTDLGACEKEVTLVIGAAGWCGPCIQESNEIQQWIVRRYGDRVGVVQVLIANKEMGQAPDQAFCEEWVQMRGLQNITVLMDANGMTQRVFNGDSIPSTLIVDRRGQIRAEENGYSPTLADLRAKIDAVLAESE